MSRIKFLSLTAAILTVLTLAVVIWFSIARDRTYPKTVGPHYLWPKLAVGESSEEPVFVFPRCKVLHEDFKTPAYSRENFDLAEILELVPDGGPLAFGGQTDAILIQDEGNYGELVSAVEQALVGRYGSCSNLPKGIDQLYVSTGSRYVVSIQHNRAVTYPPAPAGSQHLLIGLMHLRAKPTADEIAKLNPITLE